MTVDVRTGLRAGVVRLRRRRVVELGGIMLRCLHDVVGGICMCAAGHIVTDRANRVVGCRPVAKATGRNAERETDIVDQVDTVFIVSAGRRSDDGTVMAAGTIAAGRVDRTVDVQARVIKDPTGPTRLRSIHGIVKMRVTGYTPGTVIRGHRRMHAFVWREAVTLIAVTIKGAAIQVRRIDPNRCDIATSIGSRRHLGAVAVVGGTSSGRVAR